MDFTALTEEQLDQHRIDVLNEIERRQRLTQAPTQVAQIARSYVADGGSVDTLTQAVTDSAGA